VVAAHVPIEAGWPESIDAALESLLDLAAAECPAPRLVFVVARTAGPEGAARHRRSLADLAALLRRARASGGPSAAPASFEEVAVAAAASRLADSLRAEEPLDRPSLRADLRAILAPADEDPAARRAAGAHPR
jgi:hypothetical protein